MNLFAQIKTVTALGLRSLPGRFGSALVVVLGIAGVVGVLVSVLAMASGLSGAIAGAGRSDRAIVFRSGSNSELGSALSRDEARLIADAPGVQRDAKGEPIASAEVVTTVTLPQARRDAANLTLRGVGPQLAALRPELQLTAGRMFEPGLRELIVGTAAQRQFSGLGVGDRIAFRDSDWVVVGVFASGGDSRESELMADAETVLSAYRRDQFQTVTALLDSDAAFTTFESALAANPALSVDVRRERDYYRQLSGRLGDTLFFVAYVVAGIMAVGAVFGALNTMYSAVSARTREIATLRAIGFAGTAVVVSVLVEALLLAVFGGVLGGAIALQFFNGNTASTSNGEYAQLVFQLNVSLSLVFLGIAWSACIGMVGGLFPAVRAARVPIATALREV